MQIKNVNFMNLKILMFQNLHKIYFELSKICRLITSFFFIFVNSIFKFNVMKSRRSPLNSSSKKNVKELLICRLPGNGKIDILEDLRSQSNETKISIKLKSQSKSQADCSSNTSISSNTENSHNFDSNNNDITSFAEPNNTDNTDSVNNDNIDNYDFWTYQNTDSNEFLEDLSESDYFNIESDYFNIEFGYSNFNF